MAREGSDPSGPSLRITRALLAGGVVAPLAFVGLSLLDGVIQPGYSLLTGYVSDLSWMSDGWMMVAAFIATGWLLVGFASALCQVAEARLAPPWAPVLIGFMGFGLIAAGAFEIDPTWSTLTLRGELHYAATAVTGGSLALASLLTWRDRGHDRRSVETARWFLLLGFACVGLFAASLVLPSAALPNLLERIALLMGALWIAGFAWGVYSQRRRDPVRHEFERNRMAA